MNWLIWKQLYRQAIFAFGALAAFSLLLIVTGTHMATEYHQALTICSQAHNCDQLPNELFQSDGLIFDFVMAVALGIPLALGMFIGVPLLAKEYEEGTNKLVWTQAVTRSQWLTRKLVWAITGAAIYGTMLTAVVSWWSRPENSLFLGRFSELQFDSQGLMPIVYAVFAVILGAAIGAHFRKTLLSLGITLGVFIVFQPLVANFIRPYYYVRPVTQISSLTASSVPAPGPIWSINQVVTSPSGQDFALIKAPAACKALPASASTTLSQCLSEHGYYNKTVYQPANRYWEFQIIESAVYIMLSVGLLIATYGLVLKRDA